MIGDADTGYYANQETSGQHTLKAAMSTTGPNKIQPIAMDVVANAAAQPGNGQVVTSPIGLAGPTGPIGGGNGNQNPSAAQSAVFTNPSQSQSQGQGQAGGMVSPAVPALGPQGVPLPVPQNTPQEGPRAPGAPPGAGDAQRKNATRTNLKAVMASQAGA